MDAHLLGFVTSAKRATSLTRSLRGWDTFPIGMAAHKEKFWFFRFEVGRLKQVEGAASPTQREHGQSRMTLACELIQVVHESDVHHQKHP